ncbi:MAG: Rab family GTPase [Promethearchaeota archaeon]
MHTIKNIENRNPIEKVNKMDDLMFKICLFGDGGVGKTSLVNRYLTGIFKDDSAMTIGVSFHVKKLHFDSMRISLQIWDFAGEDRFRFLLPSYVAGASGGIFMYDITRYSSLKNFEDWIKIFKNGYSGSQNPLPVIMVGSKLDLQYKRAVPMEEAITLAKRHGMYGYIECSSKDGTNVNEIFQEIAKIMIRRAGLM